MGLLLVVKPEIIFKFRMMILRHFFAAALVLMAGSACAQVAGVDGGFAGLIARCAPSVHPETMAAVISAESRGHQFAIADAGPVKLPWAQRKHLVRSFYLGSLAEAVAKATELVAAGHTVSLGLAQVNDRNLAKYGVSIRDVFDPCTNVAVGGRILTDFYSRAALKFGQGAVALQAALSAYNSGDWVRGARDGYVGLVYKQVGKPLAMKSRAVVPSLASVSGVRNGGRVQTAPLVGVGGREFAMSSRSFSASE